MASTNPARQCFRLAIIATHPIQYQAPLFRRIASAGPIDLTVFYFSDHGVSNQRVDPGFGVSYAWDLPLLDGYRHYFIRNWAPRPSVSSITGLFNPGIVRALWSKRYDAVMVMGWASPSNLLTFIAAWLRRTPIWLYGDSVSVERRPWMVRVAKSVVLRLLFRGMSGFLISGTFNREFYLLYGVPVSKMFDFPWSIDNEAFAAQAARGRQARTSLLARFGIAADRPAIAYAGKLIPRKRPLDLLHAFARLRQPASLVYIGEGELRVQLEREILKLGLKNVCLTGFVNQSEIGSVLAACDVFCLPSEHDPRGTIVNEAMACGLPVVISDAVGVWGKGDIVRPGENGYIFPVGEIEKLTACLESLVGDTKLRARMGERSSAIINTWGYTQCVAGLLAAAGVVVA